MAYNGAVIKGMARRGQASLEFGPLVRHHRERLGISMTDLARAALIDQGLLSKIERGLRPPAPFPAVQRIAERFGFSSSSQEYQTLFEAAYSDRFGNREKPKVVPTLQALVSRSASPSGLLGMPPQFVLPPGAIADKAKSKGFQRQRSANAGDHTIFSALWSAAFGYLALLGIEVLNFEQHEGRMRAEFRFPDGRKWVFEGAETRKANEELQEKT